MALTMCGCGILRGRSLAPVEFTFDRISDVNVAGVTTVGKSTYADMSRTDVTMLTTAVLGQNVPTTLVVHLKTENRNPVVARMTKLGWTFYLEDRKVMSGTLEKAFELEPGKPVDVLVPLTFNAYGMAQNNTRDFFELGLALVGVPSYVKPVRLDLSPTVETEWGPIAYPEPITVKRMVN
jgi:hypothetical protein